MNAFPIERRAIDFGEYDNDVKVAANEAAQQRTRLHCAQMGGITEIETTLANHTNSLAQGDARTTNIEKMLAANNEATAEVLEILRLGKAFFKVVGHFGAFLKWATAIGAPVLAFWYTLKSGGK